MYLHGNSFFYDSHFDSKHTSMLFPRTQSTSYPPLPRANDPANGMPTATTMPLNRPARHSAPDFYPGLLNLAMKTNSLFITFFRQFATCFDCRSDASFHNLQSDHQYKTQNGVFGHGACGNQGNDRVSNRVCIHVSP